MTDFKDSTGAAHFWRDLRRIQIRRHISQSRSTNKSHLQRTLSYGIVIAFPTKKSYRSLRIVLFREEIYTVEIKSFLENKWDFRLSCLTHIEILLVSISPRRTLATLSSLVFSRTFYLWTYKKSLFVTNALEPDLCMGDLAPSSGK